MGTFINPRAITTLSWIHLMSVAAYALDFIQQCIVDDSNITGGFNVISNSSCIWSHALQSHTTN